MPDVARIPTMREPAVAPQPAGPNADEVGPRDARWIERLEAQMRVQAAVIRAQAALIEHDRRTFESVSKAARIGIWECGLPSETLRWTDGVYDLFGIPRASNLDRNRILDLYAPHSLDALNAMRAQAIAERGGFSLDAEIVTPTGHCRWVRITATVEAEAGVPRRIFGLKQDITEEKALAERTRYLAEVDAMTGLSNRGRFQARMSEPLGVLLLIDLDGFKQVNDTYGHALGDECLRQAAFRLSNLCRKGDFVARIGGDEFAVVLDERPPWSAVAALAGRIVGVLGEPIEHRGRSFQVGASVGIAFAAGCTPSELFDRADTALYAAKAAGRRTFRCFEPAMTGGIRAGTPS